MCSNPKLKKRSSVAVGRCKPSWRIPMRPSQSSVVEDARYAARGQGKSHE